MTKLKIKLKWKIFLYMLAFTALFIGLLWVFQITFLESFYNGIKTRRAETAMDRICAALESEEPGDAADLLAETAESFDISVKVVDDNFTTVFTGNSEHKNSVAQIDFMALWDLRQKARDAGGSYKLTGSNISMSLKPQPGAEQRPFSAREKKDLSIIMVRLVTLADGTSYTVFLVSAISPVSETVTTLRIQLIYISLIMTAVALAVAFVLSRRLASPISRMIGSASRLARGDYSVTFDDRTGYFELDALGDTLNYATGELAKTDQLRDDILANISHDLRTPLTMISGYAELMRDLPGENTPENADIIVQEAGRLSELVNDALYVSRLRSGTGDPLTLSVFSLTDSVRQILQRYSHFVERTGYKLEFEDGGRDIQVEADELKISQVIYNLVGNALNFTGDNRKVVVRQIDEGGTVRLEVIDSGRGIAERDVPYIFDRYYKVHSAKRRSVGTGLGLSIVKWALELHGARYGVITAKGQGSIFWFRLKKATSDK